MVRYVACKLHRCHAQLVSGVATLQVLLEQSQLRVDLLRIRHERPDQVRFALLHIKVTYQQRQIAASGQKTYRLEGEDVEDTLQNFIDWLADLAPTTGLRARESVRTISSRMGQCVLTATLMGRRARLTMGRTPVSFGSNRTNETPSSRSRCRTSAST